MKNIVRLIVASVILAGTTINLFAEEAASAVESQIPKANTLDELLDTVKRARTAESDLNKRRIQQFRADRNRQKSLLDNAEAEEKRQEQRTIQLKANYDANEQKLAEISDQLGKLFPLATSEKHMAGRELGRQEPTPSLKYQAIAV